MRNNYVSTEEKILQKNDGCHKTSAPRQTNLLEPLKSYAKYLGGENTDWILLLLFSHGYKIAEFFESKCHATVNGWQANAAMPAFNRTNVLAFDFVSLPNNY